MGGRGSGYRVRIGVGLGVGMGVGVGVGVPATTLVKGSPKTQAKAYGLPLSYGRN